MLPNNLLNECLTGGERAIQTLVKTYQRGVYQLALSILDRGYDPLETARQADIAARETFITAVNRLQRYRPETDFSIWLLGIAVRVTQRRAAAWRRERFFKRAGRRLASLFGGRAARGKQDSRGGQVSSPAGDALWEAVSAWDDRLRLPALLRYCHNFSLEQTGQILHIKEGVVHARLDQARQRLVKLS